MRFNVSAALDAPDIADVSGRTGRSGCGSLSEAPWRFLPANAARPIWTRWRAILRNAALASGGGVCQRHRGQGARYPHGPSPTAACGLTRRRVG